MTLLRGWPSDRTTVKMDIFDKILESYFMKRNADGVLKPNRYHDGIPGVYVW